MSNRFELFLLPLLPLREKVGMRGNAAKRRIAPSPSPRPSPFKGEGERKSGVPVNSGGGIRFNSFAGSRKAAGWLLAIALCLPGVAFAAAPVAASNAWIRWLPGQIPLAGYVTLHNPGAHALTIVGATSSAFKRVELHRSMTMHGGMETMQPVAAVTVPAGGDFRFAPGGYHLMLWRKQPIEVGAKLPIVFKFKNGTTLRVVFTVKGATQ